MKNKTSLVFLEQLIMVLVFALAAAACLRCFVYADQLSREIAHQDQAVILAQNGAEILKSCSGDLSEAAAHLNGTRKGETLTAAYQDLTLEIKKSGSGIPGLGQADVRVTLEGETLFSLEVCWQEVGG